MATNKYPSPPKQVSEMSTEELEKWGAKIVERACKVNQKTDAKYRLTIDSLARKSNMAGGRNGVLENALRTQSVRTWQFRRAALLHYCAGRIQISSTKDETRKWCGYVEKVMNTNLPLESRRNRHSKKTDISARLPSNWPVLLANFSGEKWRAAVLVAAATGCRPAELQNGVSVEVFGDTVPPSVRVTISGAKTGQYSGHDQRVFEFPANHKYAELLGELRGVVGLPGSPATFSSVIRSKARQLWPGLKKPITAYCLRHAAASEWKHDGYDRVQVAMMLGHRSTEMQRFYGGRRTGGTVEPDKQIRVQASQSRYLRTDRDRRGPQVKQKTHSLGIGR